MIKQPFRFNFDDKLHFGDKKFILEAWINNGRTKNRVVCPCGKVSDSFEFDGPNNPSRNDILAKIEYQAFETHTCISVQ